MSELLRRLNRIQQERPFKIVASSVVVLIALTLLVLTLLRAPESISADQIFDPSVPQQPQAEGPGARQPPPLAPGIASANRIVADVINSQASAAGPFVAVLVGTGLCLAIIWLGLGLTYLGLGLMLAVVLGLASIVPGVRPYAPIAAGIAVLVGSFTILMRLVSAALSQANPVFAIARNVLHEAVRMRVSLLFIVLLIFGMAALPALLEANQPLRYRVQAFLQYATGGAFWLIALLVLTFGAASVTFEQRDKVIWQTMTKPVSAWQYILGKWLGVVTLAAVLLAVCGSGIFLFTEHLRGQTAVGESLPFVAKDDRAIAEDRLLLETQVLVARQAVQIVPRAFDEAQLQQNINQRVDTELALNLGDINSPEAKRMADSIRARLSEELRRSQQLIYRSIAPGGAEAYVWRGLADAKTSNRPIYLRYKVNSGSNPPDQIYRLTFMFQGDNPTVEQVALGQWQTLPLLPEVIDGNGEITLRVANGALEMTPDGVPMIRANPESISFPPDALEVSYSAGSYRTNFFRVIAVLWVKLAFLAMLSITCSTFLSFPVACLVSLTVFFSAEGATFLKESLDSFATETQDGKTLYFQTLVSHIAGVISDIFTVYAQLEPTTRLVEGLRLSWGEVALGTLVLSVWTLILFAMGTLIFRRRELATYSGQ